MGKRTRRKRGINMRVRATEVMYPVGTHIRVKAGSYGYEGSLWVPDAIPRNLVLRVERVNQTWAGYKRTDVVVVSGDASYIGRRYYDITNTGLQRSFELAEVKIRKIKGDV